jgi:hypothetical protein
MWGGFSRPLSIYMAKYPSERPARAQRVPSAPPPSSASASEGMELARETARRYLLNIVLLWAAVAFAPDSEASLWVKVQCARLLAEMAGAIPQAVPEAPSPSRHEAVSDGHDTD